jgi:lipase
MPERYRAHDVPVAGGTLRVGEWRGDGPPVVLLHGLTGSHVSWLFVAEALPGRSLLAPDLRGRGRSNDLPGPYGLATHADDAAAVIRAHADAPVVVVGHSMGGFVAAVLADRHPGLISAVVLVDGGLPFAPEELEHTQSVVSTIRDGLSITFPDRVAYLDSYRVHPAFARDWTPEVEAYLDYDLVGEPPELRRSADVDAVVADQNDIVTTDLPATLAGIQVSTRFLHTSRGFLDDPPGLYAAETVTRLAARWPEIDMTYVPDVNHYTIVMSRRGAAAIAATVPHSV